MNLFVYGSLRAGGANESAFGPVARTFAVLWDHALFEYSDWYPVLLPASGHHVIGEVIQVDPTSAMFEAIDGMERGAGYVRETHRVRVLHLDPNPARSGFHAEDADVYVYGWDDDDASGPFIPSGDWITHVALVRARETLS